MLIFIDESGIHKQIDYSVFVLIYIKDEEYVNIEKIIQKIEIDFKIKKFHWAETVWKIKKYFLNNLLSLKFIVKLAILKNPVNPKIELEKILANLLTEKNIKSIIIDGKKPGWYTKKLKKFLRDKGISFKKLKIVDDDEYAGLRLADAIAGLFRWHHDGKNLEKIKNYYKKLEKKIIFIYK